MFRVKENHPQHDHAHRRGPSQPDLPLDARPGQPVQDVKPHREERRDHVRPIRNRARLRILQPDVFELKDVESGQQQPRDEHDEAGRKEQVTDLHRVTVRAVVRVPDVNGSEDDQRQDQQQAQRQMNAEHHHVKPVLVGLVRIVFEPFEKRDCAEINRIGGEHRHQSEDEQQQDAQARTDRPHVFLFRGRWAGRDVVGCLRHGLQPCAQKNLTNFNRAGYK